MHKLEEGLYSYKNEHDSCGIGFLAHIKGKQSHDLVTRSLVMLERLTHRGACGCENNTGDGAGVLTQKPDLFFQKNSLKWSISLPKIKEDYAVGMVYINPKSDAIETIQTIFNDFIDLENQTLLGWRKIPTNNNSLGPTALKGEPISYQVFIQKNKNIQNQLDFERKLYLIRKQVENKVKSLPKNLSDLFYVVSLSSQTIVYKGMLLAEQVEEYFPDLQDPDFISAIALVHSRFATNTFPSWDRAHPNRLLVHNGEINTIRGNANWMKARESELATMVFGSDVKKLFPILNADGSDSTRFDNCLEFLVLSGFSLSHALCLMVPEPWLYSNSLNPDIKAFYHYNSCIIEPWDGPASISASDGEQVISILDRNGLRPSRYWITKDNLLIMSSEVGVYDIKPAEIKEKGHLESGKIIKIDTSKGVVCFNDEIKLELAQSKPYQKWLSENLIDIKTIQEKVQEKAVKISKEEVVLLQKAFNYTSEEQLKIIGPMANDAKDPLTSMGSDIPLAVLSDQPQLLYNYFRQLFAQVTNPPIDAIREVAVTSTQTMLGGQGNLLELTPNHCQLIELDQPIIGSRELNNIRSYTKSLKINNLYSQDISILSDANSSASSLEKSLNRVFTKADQSISKGCTILILNDRGVNKGKMAIPALLVVAGLHHYLIRKGQRTRVSIVLETAEAREIHHFATLIGYGCDAVNPYLAIETVKQLVEQKTIALTDTSIAIENYLKSVQGGIIKVLSKMGISTVASYKGAQIFEAVGIKKLVVDKYFTETPTSIEGIGLDILSEDTFKNHQQAFGEKKIAYLNDGGHQSWRKTGEYHLFNPNTIHFLQKACQNNDEDAFKTYSQCVDEHDKNHSTLRSLLDFTAKDPIKLESVESVESILKRFKTGAMSYGSISAESHESLAIAMNRIGGKSNTGEGGEDPNRFTTDKNGDTSRSSIKQVASGRFGVTSHYLTNADEIQIKIAQGAKPGEGGQLSRKKVFPWIAEVRGSTPGVELISPPPHHDIYSIEDLAQLIYDLKNANRNARINVKLVAEVGVGTIAAGVAKCKADVILISGFDGGTGASPQTSIYHTGMPWELGLSETHQTLVLNGLRSRVRLETDGQLKTGRDVAISALLGAEEFGFATAPLVTMGCIMMRKCHLGTCPVGIATQDPELRKKFVGAPEHVIRFMRFIAQDLRKIMVELGFRNVDEMVGRVDKLKQIKTEHPKMKGVNLSKILYQPKVNSQEERFCTIKQDHLLNENFDFNTIIKDCLSSIQDGKAIELSYPVCNTNRSIGTILGNEITKVYGKSGLPEGTIKLNFNGSAGQSFGAFVPRGVSLHLEGDANDYVGKGLSGGVISINPDKSSQFIAEENTIIGNVTLYGASSGEAFFRGIAGERFAIRNSGATTVVEGVGMNACEYMTGGNVIVLGNTGQNFAAGMSGGLAFIWDPQNQFKLNCNTESVDLLSIVEKEDINFLTEIIKKHVKYTQSSVGQKILDQPELISKQFIKVYPRDYRRVIEIQKKMLKKGLTEEKILLEAFKESVA